MIETSKEIKHISAALLKFQGAVDGVGKNSANPHFKSRYANLENVVDTARPELQAAGIVFMQSGGAIVDGVMAMTTRLIHVESGEWIQGTMDIALGKRDPQGVGSAQTYAQRYHLMAMLGLPPVDDDGKRRWTETTAAPSRKRPRRWSRISAQSGLRCATNSTRVARSKNSGCSGAPPLSGLSSRSSSPIGRSRSPNTKTLARLNSPALPAPPYHRTLKGCPHEQRQQGYPRRQPRQ